LTRARPLEILLAMDRSPARLQSHVEDMIQRCREAGMNVTPQRVAIYRALLASEEHPTPEMLYRTVSRKMRSLSLATIYKTLDSLVELGLVRAVPVVGDKRRFDANSEAHHHLVCSSCGAIRDYYTHDFDRLVPRKPVDGFKAHSVSVNISGVCGDCAKRNELRIEN
jgi:Fur family transcriptional regulator, peroxide stress response regulator